MKNRIFRNNYFRKNDGSTLIGALVALVILSLFAIALLNFSQTGIKNTVVERDYNAVYYIAESGINHASMIMENAGTAVDLTATNHQTFYQEFQTYLNSQLDGKTIADFDTQFGSAPEANISVNMISKIEKPIDGGGTELLVQYEVESEGIVGDRKRTLVTTYEVSHKVSTIAPIMHHAFDYAIFSSGPSALNVPKGSTVEGDIYGKTVNLLADDAEINGNIISEKNIRLESGIKINGDVYAIGLDGSNGDVVLNSAQTTVTGNINAKGKVILGTNCKVHGNIFCGGESVLEYSGATVTDNINAKGNVTVKGGSVVVGNVYSGKNISMLNTQNLSQGILGNAYASQNIYMQNNTNIKGLSYAGGTTNQHTEENINATIPPLSEPQFPSFTPINPPSLTSFDAGSEDIKLLANWQMPGPQYVSPGSYGTLEFSWNNTVKFVSGNYYFKNIKGASSNKIQLDFSDGPINIYVTENATFGHALTFFVSENGESFSDVKALYNSNPNKAKEIAGKFYMEIHGNLTVQASTGTWFGTTLTKGNFNISSAKLLIGAFSIVNGKVNITPLTPDIIYAPPIDSAAGTGEAGFTPGGQTGSGGKGSTTVISVNKPIREK